MRARYHGVVAGVFMQVVANTAFAAPVVNNAVAATVNPALPGAAPMQAPTPGAVAVTRAAAIVPAVARAAQVPQTVPAAIAPAALTADGELEDESGMFGGGESQVLTVAPSQDATQHALGQRNWLRQPRDSKPQATEETNDSGVSLTVLAFLLLGGLGGGAIFMRLKRPGAKPWLPAAPVRVLSTTKVGPKATLVTADVYGRVMLLGVTESSVTELGWIDAASEHESIRERDADDDVPVRRSEPPESIAAPSRAAFGQVLNNVFGNDSRAKEPEFRGNPNVAALIAARETRDVVTTSFSRAGERRAAVAPTNDGGRVETQVAGLMRRRR
jgi:flagellar biogenesis protein FliO